MSCDLEPVTIASQVQLVFLSYRGLAEAMSRSYTHLSQLLPRVEDEISRFKMWAGNLGAHQRGPSSLDYRLREAPVLCNQVINLVADISQSLNDALALASHMPPSWKTYGPKDPFPGGPRGLLAGNTDDVNVSDSEDEDDVSGEQMFSRLCHDIGEAVDCLLGLSVAIANPAPHERVRKLGAGPEDDVSYREEFDIRYVQDKLPGLAPDLSEFLGKSITRRRQFFRYREAHHARLVAGLQAASRGEKDTAATEISTAASSIPAHFKTIGAPNTAAIDEDLQSNSGVSATSYATSAGCLAGDENQVTPLTVPQLPVDARKGVFECPFCYRMISARNRAAWKRHVFGDLRPYTCLFEGCIKSNKDFDRRRRWQAHIFQDHWRSWFCPFQCEPDRGFSSVSDLRHHLKASHMPDAPKDQLEAVLALGDRPAPKDKAEKCPVCTKTVVGLRMYVKHVGRHLEQLALFALPGLDPGNAEGAREGSNDEEGQESDSSEGNSADVEPLRHSRPLTDAEPLRTPGSLAYSDGPTALSAEEPVQLPLHTFAESMRDLRRLSFSTASQVDSLDEHQTSKSQSQRQLDYASSPPTVDEAHARLEPRTTEPYDRASQPVPQAPRHTPDPTMPSPTQIHGAEAGTAADTTEVNPIREEEGTEIEPVGDADTLNGKGRASSAPKSSPVEGETARQAELPLKSTRRPAGRRFRRVSIWYCDNCNNNQQYWLVDASPHCLDCGHRRCGYCYVQFVTVPRHSS